MWIFWSEIFRNVRLKFPHFYGKNPHKNSSNILSQIVQNALFIWAFGCTYSSIKLLKFHRKLLVGAIYESHGTAASTPSKSKTVESVNHFLVDTRHRLSPDTVEVSFFSFFPVLEKQDLLINLLIHSSNGFWASTKAFEMARIAL